MGGWLKWMMGIKEDTCDEHWVLYVSGKSLNSTRETNITLYVNCNLNKTLKFKTEEFLPPFLLSGKTPCSNSDQYKFPTSLMTSGRFLPSLQGKHKKKTA